MNNLYLYSGIMAAFIGIAGLILHFKRMKSRSEAERKGLINVLALLAYVVFLVGGIFFIVYYFLRRI